MKSGMKNIFAIGCIVIVMIGCRTSDQKTESDNFYYKEAHRPQIHFTPEAKWMNDPNGMVYYDGEYHLFYQHYPDSDVWGPMHWGHAVSRDMIQWQHLPIALYPDSLGMIFSGSAVFDVNNSSGLGTAENPPLVAIFTYHFMEGEKAGRNDYQTQGIAYSIDKGRTWKKYENNPVLKNPGIKDFRDPKVMWHDASRQWIMILAVLDHVEFYGSQNLIQWKKLSEFGKDYGSHGGVWECPDLFQLTAEGEQTKKWVMLLSINPGGPNGGSCTQYFIGDFDGQKFSSETPKEDTLWIDYGPDNYAGVTWSNIPANDGRRLFLGWMSNWAYGTVVPTSPWRSAMTIPRELKLNKVDSRYYVTSTPAKELNNIVTNRKETTSITVSDTLDLTTQLGFDPSLSWIEGEMEAKDFSVEFSNTKGEKAFLSYDAAKREYSFNRTGSGKTDFSSEFQRVSTAPRISTSNKIRFSMITDVSSVEIFFDGGLTNLTGLFFPDEPFTTFRIISREPLQIDRLEGRKLRSVWEGPETR